MTTNKDTQGGMADGAQRPFLSIITVTLNAEATLEPTLLSVIGQTCQHYEHIVVDGLSSDGTMALLEKHPDPRRKVFRQKDDGLYDAMNHGLAEAEGDYVVFLNAGDAFHAPDTLRRIFDAAMDNEYPGVIYGRTDIVDASRRRLGPRHLEPPRELTVQSFAQGMVVCHQAFVVLRKLAGHYVTSLRYSADYDWCIRCVQVARRNLFIDAVLVDYLREGLTTRHRWRSLRERFAIMSYYYGFFPTLWRHLRFVPRYLRRRRLEKSFGNTDPSAPVPK